jgi:hypothetical protein
MPGFEPGGVGSIPTPAAFSEPCKSVRVVEQEMNEDIAEQLLLVVTPGSEPGGRWFDSNFRSSMDGSHPAG